MYQHKDQPVPDVGHRTALDPARLQQVPARLRHDILQKEEMIAELRMKSEALERRMSEFTPHSNEWSHFKFQRDSCVDRLRELWKDVEPFQKV